VNARLGFLALCFVTISASAQTAMTGNKAPQIADADLDAANAGDTVVGHGA